MNKLGIILISVFICLVAFYFFVLKPEKYNDSDLYNEIRQKGYITVGVNTDSKPFAFYDEDGNLCGYDIDLARYIAQYIVGNREYIKFVAVTSYDRIMKASTGEVDIVIATMTITPQRKQIIDFSIPYDVAGQALLVRKSSKITSIADLSGQSVGVIWGTTAEKNMLNLAPTANIIGFKSYVSAYNALKNGSIEAITSDDTILSRFAIDDDQVKLLPKRYSKEPYGIGFRKGKGSAKLKTALNDAIADMKQKNVINRLHKKWLVL